MDLEKRLDHLIEAAIKGGLEEAFSSSGFEKVVAAGLREVEAHLSVRVDEIELECHDQRVLALLEREGYYRGHGGEGIARLDDRCDHLDTNTGKVDERLSKRCDKLNVALTSVGERLQQQLKLTDRGLGTLERKVEGVEAREWARDKPVHALHRKVTDWGVVFETMANRISGLEQVSLRLLNHIETARKEEPEWYMECGDCPSSWTGAEDSPCPACESTNTQPADPDREPDAVDRPS